jgi:hypothetical protein
VIATIPGSRDRRRVAIALSILVHIIGFVLLVRLDPRDIVPRPIATPREIVTVAHLRIERPRARPTATPLPIDRPAPKLIVPRVVVPTIARPRVVFVPRRPAPQRPIPRVRSVPHELAKIVPHVPPDVPKQPRFDDAQIAKIERSLGDAIATDRHGRDPLVVAAAPLAAPVHHGYSASGFGTGDRSHHGLCDPVKSWTADTYDYYYVICNVRFSDGTYERESVPWPVRFPPGDDPFAGTAKGEKPLSLPLPGWQLPAGETIADPLRAYARDHGVEL